jgi:SOS-response transcriptional repressor LexA
MTGRIEKTVFISYRRTNLPWALCIYQNLTMHGYDVFFDYLSIDSGSFEKVILENIKARAHFLIVLTPSALERCSEPKDWLRREIETAMTEKRNIIPVMTDGFDFSSRLVTEALTGKLAALRSYNGLKLYAEYFFEAMEKLRQRFLNVSLEDVHLHPLSDDANDLAENQKSAADKAGSVDTNELRIQERIELDYAHGSLRIPILGHIAAGLPLPKFDPDLNYIIDDDTNAVEIPRSLLPMKEKSVNLFALEVKGNSMIDAMIQDGDILIMKPVSKVRNGEMVAVWLPRDKEATLKYFFKERDRYRLQPANPTMKPIYVRKSEPLEIRGKVVLVIRRKDISLAA